MNQGSRKYPAIDILKLYSGKFPGFEDDTVIDHDNATWDASKSARLYRAHEKWNRWLKKCLAENNLNDLIKVRYGLQVGMDDLVKLKLNTPQVNEMFLRWMSSIERTARSVVRNRIGYQKPTNNEMLLAKRKLDLEFDEFLKKSAF